MSRGVILPAATVEWTSPERVLDPTRRAFGGRIDLDPCGCPASIVAPVRQVWMPYHLPPGFVAGGGIVVGDGLQVPWIGNVFVNPPYGRALDAWMERGRVAGSVIGNNVAMLVPASTSRKCWQKTAPRAAVIVLFRGRLKFGNTGKSGSAGFSSALVVWTRSAAVALAFAREFASEGHVIVNLGVCDA